MDSKSIEDRLVNDIAFNDVYREWDEKIQAAGTRKVRNQRKKTTSIMIVIVLMIGTYNAHPKLFYITVTYCALLLGLRSVDLYTEQNPLLFFIKPILSLLHDYFLPTSAQIHIRSICTNLDQYFYNWPTDDNDDWEQESMIELGKIKNNVTGTWNLLGLENAIGESRNLRVTTTLRDQHRRPVNQQPLQTVSYGHKFNTMYSGPILMRAGMDDDEFLRMVKKRLADRIKPIDFEKVRRNQFKVMHRIVKNMPMHTNRWQDEDFIAYALKSKGSAGRWGKHKMMEGILKDGALKEVLSMWKEFISSRLAHAIEAGVIYVPGIIGYEIYKKNELLACTECKGDYPPVFKDNQEKDDFGMKVTRMIQAPHLPVRVMDAKHHVDWNDSYAAFREQTYGKVGTRFLQDICRFLDPILFDISLESDFSDYDASNSPQKIRWCANVRIECEKRNGHKDLQSFIDSVRYLKWKAEVHLMRTMQTTWNVKVRVVGGLASGDITTSDDGTLRTEVYIEACSENIHESRAVGLRVIDGGANGDDTIIKTTITEGTHHSKFDREEYLLALSTCRNIEDVVHCETLRYKSLLDEVAIKKDLITLIINDAAEDLGLYLKFVDVVPSYDATFLTCKPAVALLHDNGGGNIKRICVPYRQYDRHYKKMCVSESIGIDAELDTDKGKTIGKLISYMCLSPFMPVAWVICLVQLRRMIEANTEIRLAGDLPWILQSIDMTPENVYNPWQLLKEMYGLKSQCITLLLPLEEVMRAEEALKLASVYDDRVNLMANQIGIKFNMSDDAMGIIQWDLWSQSEQIYNLEYKVGFRNKIGRENWTAFMASSFETYERGKRKENKAHYDVTITCKHIKATNFINYEKAYFPRKIICSDCIPTEMKYDEIKDKDNFGTPACIIIYPAS